MSQQVECPSCASKDVLFVDDLGEYYKCQQCNQRFVVGPAIKPLRVFFSYGHDNNEPLVSRIKGDLEKRGHDVWFDKSEIKAGHDWRESITKGILKSDRVLSFLSVHSTRDPGVCLDEIAIAIGVKSGNVQTILVEREQNVRPPASISHVQWLDLQDWQEQRAAGDHVWEEWYTDKIRQIIALVESDESRHFAGEIDELANRLRPISSDSRIRQLLRKGLVGREWLIEAIEEWRNAADRSSRLLWIQGAPGVGKSAVAAHLAHYGRDKVIAVQFCQYDKPDHRSANRIVRTLAFQIAARLPEYRQLLLALPETKADELDNKSPAELFDYLLANPLCHAIDGGRERCLIVIDALDEAAGDGRNELVEMLAQNAPRLPDWIALVVTSRPESNVAILLQGPKPLVLDTSTELNRADVRAYLRQKLALHLDDRPDAERVVEEILEKSEGVFLYAERFADEVLRGHLSLDHPQQFPQGLGGIFFQHFQRQFPDLKDFRRCARPALGAIVAAREPLPLEILQRLFNWRDEELRDFMRPLGSFFLVTGESGFESIKPYHKSLADWLATEPTSGSFFVSTAEGNCLLADFCVAAARTADVVTLAYVKRHVAAHLFAEKRWDDLIAAVLSPHLELLDRWTARGEQAEGDACLRKLTTHLVKRGQLDLAAEFSTQRARVLTQLGKHADAEALLRQALRWATGNRKLATHSVVWHELGSLLFYRGDHQKAVSCYRRALQLAKEESPTNHAEAAANLVALATIARARQRHSEAMDFSREAIVHADGCGDYRHLVAARRLLANSLRSQLLLEEAKDELAVAQMLCVLCDFPFDQSEVMLSKAWLAYEHAIIHGTGAADAAEPLFQAALSQARHVSHFVAQVDALLGLTWCAFNRLDAVAAAERLDQAAMAPGLATYQLLQGGVRVGRASLALLQGNLPSAKNRYETARKFCGCVNQTAWQADACVGLAAVHHRQGMDEMASIAEKEALELARRCGPLKVRVVEHSLERIKADPFAVPY